MKTEHYGCPKCGQTNRVNVPEDFEDRIGEFIESAPAATGKALLALAAGVFVAPPVGLMAAGAILAASVYNDGTVKCANCGERFRVREIW